MERWRVRYRDTNGKMHIGMLDPLIGEVMPQRPDMEHKVFKGGVYSINGEYYILAACSDHRLRLFAIAPDYADDTSGICNRWEDKGIQEDSTVRDILAMIEGKSTDKFSHTIRYHGLYVPEKAMAKYPVLWEITEGGHDEEV